MRWRRVILARTIACRRGFHGRVYNIQFEDVLNRKLLTGGLSLVFTAKVAVKRTLKLRYRKSRSAEKVRHREGRVAAKQKLM
jgi:hypothetical protein